MRRELTAGAVAIAISVALVAGCGSQPTPSGTPVAVTANPSAPASFAVETQPASSTAASTPSAADVQQATDLIAHADPSDSTSLDAIEGQLLYTSAGGEAARAALEQGVGGSELWAALWVYGTTGSDPAPVARYMADSDPSIRAMAAADDVQLGDATGFAVLAPLLNDTDSMSASEPPKSISAFVEGALDTVVDPASAPSTDADAGTWASWLTTNASSLTFDANDGVWTKQ